MIARIGRKFHGHHALRRGLSSASTTREGGGLSSLFTKEQRATLGEVHELASQTRNLAREIGRVAIKEESLLSDIARPNKDDESSSPSLFTVVLCGEFNAGKSTVVNALLGMELLDSGVLPTTDKITIVLAGRENDSISGDDSRKKIVDSATKRMYLLPSSKYPILEDLAVVDTPGSNASLSLEHTSTTLKILHDADLILFVTSADRPFGESEKEILASIKSYRKRVALVINKMDILERQQGEDHGDESKQQVEDFVVEHASEYLGARPVVIPVSVASLESRLTCLYQEGAKVAHTLLFPPLSFRSVLEMRYLTNCSAVDLAAGPLCGEDPTLNPWSNSKVPESYLSSQGAPR